MTDTDDPRLGIWDTLIEPIGGGDRVISQFKESSLNVDRHSLPMIAFFDLLAHL